MSDQDGKSEETFDWMKFLKLHPLVVAGSLMVSGAAGGVAGYVAFSGFVESQVKTALAKADVTNAVAKRLAEEHADKLRGEDGAQGSQGLPGPKGDQGPQGEKGEPGKNGSNATVPANAVVAFDLRGGCPAGWTDVGRREADRFAGRMLVVAGPRVDRDDNGTTLRRDHGDQGGVENHTLSTDEMPSHNHGGATRGANTGAFVEFPQKRSHTGGFEGRVPFSTSDHVHPISHEGGGNPHNNMPPYIVLHFCKKGQ